MGNEEFLLVDFESKQLCGCLDNFACDDFRKNVVENVKFANLKNL